MAKTIVFVTNQVKCDRIIHAARKVADKTKTELNVLEVLDSEYELNPEAVDYLFMLSKQVKATMRIVFSGDKLEVMREIISQYDCSNVVTGMPSSNESALYGLWKDFSDKRFHTVDEGGELVEVACNKAATA